MLSPIEPIHNRLQETVNSLYDEEHDPFAIAGCMLAIAIQLYRTQDMKWDGIKVLSVSYTHLTLPTSDLV